MMDTNEPDLAAAAGQAEDGVFQVGVTRIGYAYIFGEADPNPPSGSRLVFGYDQAGNQVHREMVPKSTAG